MNIDYCFHTHTYRCGHARGTDEEYVLEAIKAGIKVMGFSDHVFLPNHPQKGTRGDYSLLDDYVSSVKTLQEKYKDKIKIYLGFECEYFDEYFDYYKELKEKGFDYFILGQHFLMNDNELFYFRNSVDEDEDIDRYYNYVEKAVKTGLFSYFAHPDLYVTVKEKFDEHCEEIAHKICKLSLEYDIPLEINLNGMTWRLPRTLKYPCESFWRIVSEYGNKVVIGYDSHYPEFFNEEKYMNEALEIVKKFNLNLLNKEEVIKKIKTNC